MIIIDDFNNGFNENYMEFYNKYFSIKEVKEIKEIPKNEFENFVSFIITQIEDDSKEYFIRKEIEKFLNKMEEKIIRDILQKSDNLTTCHELRNFIGNYIFRNR